MKYFSSLLFVFTFTFLQANPISPPEIGVSEVMFDSENNWILELELFYYNLYPFGTLDSICITTSSGTSKLERYTINVDNEGSGILVVRNDSLSSDLFINAEGDCIYASLHFADYESYNENKLIFGNYPNSKIRAPQLGESVAGVPAYYLYYGYYCICKSPTIGEQNTGIGMKGTITGTVYDKDNQPLSLKNIIFKEFPFLIGAQITPQEDGTFSSEIFAYQRTITRLYYDTIANHGIYIHIIQVDIDIEPNEILPLDIYLLEDVIYGQSDIKELERSLLKIYPNPIKNRILNYETELPIRALNCSIALFDLSGKQIAHYPISENSGTVHLPQNLSHGAYIVNFYANNKVYHTTKIVIAP